MASRTPPVDNVGGQDGQAEENQAKINQHGPLAQGEGAGREAQSPSDAGDDAETEREHDADDHEGDGNLPEQRVVEVSGQDLDGVHAKV